LKVTKLIPNYTHNVELCAILVAEHAGDAFSRFPVGQLYFIQVQQAKTTGSMDASQPRNDQPGFGVIAVTQKLRSYNIIRVSNIIN
jgi:hypothetical protein